MADQTAIGIDLGTIYTNVAVFKNGRVEVLTNEIASNLTPSYVSFTDKVRLVGDSAKNQAAMNAQNTICGMRRLIGQKYNYNIPGSQYRSFRVTNDDRRAKISVQYRGKTKELYPEQTTAILLAKMKDMAEKYLGHPVKNAVVTVPAHFNNSQRRATKDAGLVAGLKSALINETTAAALAHVYDKKEEFVRRERTVLVYNLGGGFLDVSLTVIKNLTVEVKATASDRALGGEDFDNRLIDYCVSEFKFRHGKDITSSQRALCRLRKACEKAKRDLSFTVSASIDIDELFEGIDFSLDISRKKFEEICSELFRRATVPVMNVLHETRLLKENIDEVLMVGGSTRIPLIQKQLSDYFGDKKLNMSMNPDLAAVAGAAIYGAREFHEPTVQDIEFVDVVSSSYGYYTVGGAYETLLQKNTPIPVECSSIYSNVPNIVLTIFQGEKERARESTFLGEFHLQGSMRGRKELKIKLVFIVNRHGILSAFGVVDGCLHHLQLPFEKYRLSPEQVDDFKMELDQFEEDEKNERLRVEAKNNLQCSIDRLQRSLDDGKIPVHAREDVRVIQSKIVAWLDENSNAEKRKLEEMLKKYKECVLEAKEKPLSFIDERKQEAAKVLKQYPGTAFLASSVKIEEKPSTRSYADVTKSNLALHPGAQQVSYKDTTVTYLGVYPQYNPPVSSAIKQRQAPNPPYTKHQPLNGTNQTGYRSASVAYNNNVPTTFQTTYQQSYGSTGFYH